MKRKTLRQSATSRYGAPWVATLVMALVLGTGGTPGFAGDGGGSNEGGEEVGTLPVFSQRDALDELPYGKLSDLYKPAFVLVGDHQDILDLITYAGGTGFVTVHESASKDRTLYAFHGQVQVALDRATFELGRVAVHFRPGAEYVGGRSAVEWDGYWSGRRGLSVQGGFCVPLERLVNAGLLDRAPATLWSASPKGEISMLRMSTRGTQLVLEQERKQLEL